MKTRKRFNRFVNQLSKIYDMSYHDVERIYYSQGCDIASTKMIINLKSK